MYDLRAPGRNYQALYNAIKSYQNWGKITESSWAVITHQTSSQIRDYLQGFVDYNDRLMVIKSGGEAAWQNALADNNWLRENLAKL